MKALAATGGSISHNDLLEHAIAWAVKLESGTIGAREREACAAWREADPSHEHAWQQVQQIEQVFRAGPAGALTHRALQGVERLRGVDGRRRRALQMLALGAVGIATGLFALRLAPPWQRRETQITAIGERRRLQLGDGTALALNTNTEVEIVFSPLRRTVRLRHGEILIDTGKDADSFAGRRPFWVETDALRLEAIGTRFSVRELDGQTQVHVFEGAVDVYPPGDAVTRVSAGQAVMVDRSRVTPLVRDERSRDAEAWADGALVVKRMPLDVFVAELSRYRAAPLYCAADAANLRVSGVFQLGGPDAAGRALETLTQTLPLRLESGADGSLTVSRR